MGTCDAKGTRAAPSLITERATFAMAGFVSSKKEGGVVEVDLRGAAQSLDRTLEGMNMRRASLRLQVDCASHQAKGGTSDDIDLSAKPNVVTGSR